MIKTGWTNSSKTINGASTLHNEDDKKRHAIRRRLISHAFSDAALRAAEEYVLDRIRVWCYYLGGEEETREVADGKWSEAKDMGTWSTLLTLDVLGELCFGSSFRSMETQDVSVMRLLMQSTKLFHKVSFHSAPSRFISRN